MGGLWGWMSATIAIIAAELIGRGEATALHAMMSSGMSQSRVDQLVGFGFMHAGLKSGRLGATVSMRVAQARVTDVTRGIARSEWTQELARGQVARLMNVAKVLTKKHPEGVGDGFLERLRSMAENSDAVSAVRDIRAAIDETQRSVFSGLARRVRPASGPTAPDTSKPSWLREQRGDARSSSPESARGVPWRNRPLAQAAPKTATRPAPAPTLSPAEELLKTPPDTLTLESLRVVTAGKIQIERAAWDKMVTTYLEHQSLREAMLRRLWELSNSGGTNWMPLEHVDKCLRGRVGLYHRLLVERAGGRTRIYDFLPRKALESKRAWHPPKASDVIEL
jgi:hypothetical protein